MRAVVVATEDRFVLGQMIQRGASLGYIDTDIPLSDLLGGAVELRVRLEVAAEDPRPARKPRRRKKVTG
jgi:hypothetical protein